MFLLLEQNIFFRFRGLGAKKIETTKSTYQIPTVNLFGQKLLQSLGYIAHDASYVTRRIIFQIVVFFHARIIRF